MCGPKAGPLQELLPPRKTCGDPARLDVQLTGATPDREGPVYAVWKFTKTPSRRGPRVPSAHSEASLQVEVCDRDASCVTLGVTFDVAAAWIWGVAPVGLKLGGGDLLGRRSSPPTAHGAAYPRFQPHMVGGFALKKPSLLHDPGTCFPTSVPGGVYWSARAG